ncbi:MAG TPA: hydantoinase/oxoprolinase family protein [Polyangia bacterium]
MRVGVDSGGTFTDVVAVDEAGVVTACKLPSRRDEPWVPVIAGARRLTGTAAVAELSHSTTVATNALLERRGGPVALVTTAGFEDVLEIGRQARPKLYALHPVLPAPLVEAELRFGVDERLGPDGGVVRALTAAALEELRVRVAAAVSERGVRAVAVCLLHAYANDAHERAVAEALAPLGVPISRSSAVLPLPREYERTSTTVVDAYVRPIVAPYVARLAAVDEAGAARVRILASNGGAMSAADAAAEPARTLLSGPAAGVVGVLAVARAGGVADAITLDMGGTSTDVALIAGGQVALADEATIAGCVLQLPMMAIHTVGAGGGSIVYLDPAGALKVGPASAGAEPGPAAYDRGGTLPTVTDANLVLGRLPETGLLGGAMPLSLPRARAAIAPLAERLGVGVEAAAEDVLAVAAAVMARAIKVVSVERGHDPAAFTLLPFGGAGALHACAVARELGITRILVPPSPGLLCAYGALAADVAHDFVATLLRPAGARLPPSEIAGAFLPLTQAAARALDSAGVDAAARRLERSATLRYRGQTFDLTVPLKRDDGGAVDDLVAAFHDAHRARYGYALAHEVELVTVRLRAVGKSAPLPPPVEPRDDGPVELGRVALVAGGRAHDAPLLSRRRLVAGVSVVGPALIAEYSATTFLPPGARAEVLPSGALALTP